MLREQIDAAEEDTSAAEAARAALNAQDEQLRSLESRVLAQIIEAEKELRSLYRRLPPPLQQELRPLFNALPENPATSTAAIAQRIQPVAAMLTQIQRFNGSVTVVDAFREFEAGTPVQIESIYFGLGASFYVDKSNTHAGVGVMGPNGWTWRDDPSIAQAVRSFLEIYRGSRQATYIFLPIEIQ